MLYNTTIYVNISLPETKHIMAKQKKESKNNKKIEEKRKKLRDKNADADKAEARGKTSARTGLEDTSDRGRRSGKSSKSSGSRGSGTGSQSSKKSAGTGSANSRKKNSGKTSGRNRKDATEAAARSGSKGKKSKSQSRKSVKTGLPDDSFEVRGTGQDRYAYGSFGYDEYKTGAFSNDGYRYTGSRQEEPEIDAKTQAKLDAKRIRLRREADRKRVTPKNRNRLLLGYSVILLLMIALIFRMGYWQIVKADELRTKAAAMQKVDTEIEPARGSIYDSNKNVLAESVTEYELYGYTQYMYKDPDITVSEKAETVRKLAEITGEEEVDVRKKLSDPTENLVLLCDGLTKDQVEKAEKIWESKVMVKTKTARYYPNGAFAAQILGGVDSNNVGRSGLEYEYNSILAGVKGRTVRTTDRDGNTVSGSKTKYYDPKDGSNIVTTVDSVIQSFVESALETGMKKTGASGITCIVMNPKTGDILAMASTPEFDPNNPSEPVSKSEKKRFKKMTQEEQTEYLSKMWTINGISSIYEPGSTFKLITAASALESGSSTKKSRYYCDGHIHVGNYNLRCLGVHGKQTLKEAVGNSCNPGLAKVALDMGAETFYNYIDMFGFYDKTGVDLPGETDSIVKSAEGMGDVDLATTGYGQGIAVTPLQILTAVNCFGNGGVLMKPKLVREIVDNEGNVVETIPDTEVRQVVSEKTADKMCDIMEYYVADSGSGTEAYVPGYRVGGKTGTANLVEGGAYASNATNTSFVAMAPMDDPQISMICIVYRPTKIHYGNYTAGPIVKEVMEKSLQYLGVERKYTKSEAKEAKKNQVKVPDVTGMDSSDAIRLLKYNGLTYKISPEPEDGKEENFVVLDQNPKPDAKVEKDSVVYIYSE